MSCRLLPQLCGRRRIGDDLADAQPEVLVDDDHLAAGDQRAVHQQVSGRAGGPVELDDLTRVQRQQFLHGHAGAADLDRDLHGHVPQEVQAATLAARRREGHLQGKRRLVLAVGEQRDGHEHALVAQSVEGGDRLHDPLGGDPDPAERRGRRLEGRPQGRGDVHPAHGELFRASTTSAETTRTTSPLTSPDRPAATAEAASRGSGTESGSLTGAPGASAADAGTSAAAALAAAITTAETVWESWSVRGAVMLSPRWRSSAP